MRHQRRGLPQHGPEHGRRRTTIKIRSTIGRDQPEPARGACRNLTTSGMIARTRPRTMTDYEGERAPNEMIARSSCRVAQHRASNCPGRSDERHGRRHDRHVQSTGERAQKLRPGASHRSKPPPYNSECRAGTCDPRCRRTVAARNRHLSGGKHDCEHDHQHEKPEETSDIHRDSYINVVHIVIRSQSCVVTAARFGGCLLRCVSVAHPSCRIYDCCCGTADALPCELFACTTLGIEASTSPRWP